jgi:hypothetical protein
MNNEPFDEFERGLPDLQPAPVPPQLRAAVLADVHRELRADRWDRRMARTAVALLAVGIAMNVLSVTRSHRATRSEMASIGPPESLTQVAVAVAEATDAQTARRFARQWAARAGWRMGGAEAAAIDAALNQRLGRDPLRGKDG